MGCMNTKINNKIRDIETTISHIRNYQTEEGVRNKELNTVLNTYVEEQDKIIKDILVILSNIQCEDKKLILKHINAIKNEQKHIHDIEDVGICKDTCPHGITDMCSFSKKIAPLIDKMRRRSLALQKTKSASADIMTKYIHSIEYSS